jgi:hypothetical protein
MFLLIWCVSIVVILVVVAVTMRGWEKERQRSVALERLARSMGFTFERSVDPEQLRALGYMRLFGVGQAHQVRNIATGRLHDDRVRAFDYHYTIGQGRQETVMRQTVAFFPGTLNGMPDFEMVPRDAAATTGPVYGYQDVNFGAGLEFSRRYSVRGSDHQAIREALHPDALVYIGAHQGWNVEIRGGNMVIYRVNERVEPNALRTFVDETHGVLSAIRRM